MKIIRNPLSKNNTTKQLWHSMHGKRKKHIGPSGKKFKIIGKKLCWNIHKKMYK